MIDRFLPMTVDELLEMEDAFLLRMRRCASCNQRTMAETPIILVNCPTCRTHRMDQARAAEFDEDA